MLAVLALHIEHLAHLLGGLRAVVFIEHALDGDSDAPHALRLPVAVQRLMGQRDKTDIVPGKPVVQIVALVAVVAEGARQVLDDHTVYAPAPDI